MARPEGSSEGAQLANYLDQLFKGGNFADFVNSAPAEPIVPSEDEVLRQKLKGYMESFVGSISLGAISRASDNRRAAANIVRNGFAIFKTGLIQDLSDKSAAESEIEAVDRLTLKDVAIYTGEQFDRFKKEAATLPPGTPEQQEARDKSDYWSIIEEIITPASDPD